MKLTEQQEKLFEFIKIHHDEQKRKYTGEPYWNHLYNVASIVSEHCPEGVEIALCHDLFEDTECTEDELYETLIYLNYDKANATRILNGVYQLTDQYTSSAYPDMNRLARKRAESLRLGSISEICQSVKYADLIDNTSSIVEHDKGFAVKYLQEKYDILNVMRKGNINLLVKCCATLYFATKNLQS